MLIAFKNIIIYFCLIILNSYQLVRPAEANELESQYPIFNSKRNNNPSDIKDTESRLNKEAANHKQKNESSDLDSEKKIKKPKNTEEKSLEYLTTVYGIIMPNMTVPEQVRNIYYEGKIVIQLNTDGKIIKQWVYKKSGSNILDIAAMSAVTLSGPFPPPPSKKAQNLIFKYATDPTTPKSSHSTTPGARDETDKLLQNAERLFDEESYDKAEPLYKRVLAIREKALGSDHIDVATLLYDLGWIYYKQGRFPEAEQLEKRALAIREKSLGPDHVDVASSLNDLAVVYDEQARYEEAEPLYKRALAIREKSLGANHIDVAWSANNLAYTYVNQGRYSEAEPLYKRSLAIREKSLDPDHPDISNSLNNLASLYDLQGRHEEGLPIVRRLMKEGKPDKFSVFPVLYNSELKHLIAEQEVFNQSYNILQSTSSSAAAEAINRLAQRYAVGTSELAELVRKQQDMSAEGEKLEKMLIAAASKPIKKRNQTVESQMRNRLEEIARDKKNLTEVLIKRFPEYIALSNPQPLTLLETQKLLADDEAVVAIDIGDKHSYAWVITKSDRSWTELPTNMTLLDNQVQQLRQSLTFSADKAFDTVLAYKIYQEIFGPIASKIIGKKRLSVIANGALTSLPFGLLITTEPNNKAFKDMDWLIRSHALVVIPSIYSLKTMRAQATSSSAVKPMIAFADPIFSRKAHLQARSERMAMRSLSQFYQGSRLDVRSLGEHLSQLPGTRNEVQAIAKSVGADPTDIKLGLDATVTTLKQTKLDQYRIVYFATHGLVAGDLKKFSKVGAEPALVLTIPEKPTDQDNGLLQASEISELKLNADWVVLSACNTASSDGEDAEALSGLARAFLYAGARSLVVSHWDVSDEATKQLMSSLFKISAKNPQLSHGEALREATLELLDNSKTNDEAHPRMWAPFIVVGEPATK